MTQEEKDLEKKALLKEIQDDVAKLLSDSQKSNVNKDELEKAVKQLNEKIEKNLNNEELKQLNLKVEEIQKQKQEQDDILIAQGLELSKLKEDGVKTKSELKLGDILKAELIAGGYTEKNSELSNITGSEVFRVKGSKNSTKTIVNFETKAAIDMTTALMLLPGSDPGTSVGYLTAYQMRDVLLNSSTDMSMLEILPVTPISDKYFGVVVEYTEVDGTATTDEDTAAGKSSFLLKTQEFKVFKINTYYKTSEENFEDVDMLVAKMNRIGADRIKQKVNEKILSASGDNSTDIKGILVAGNHTDFAASTYAGTVDSPTIVNLVGKMKLQAELTDDKVNVVVLNPADIDKIEQDKDAINNSVYDRSVVFDTVGRLVSIKGLLVAKTKKITANQCLVMSNEAAEVGLRRGIGVIIGLDSDDLTTGMRTLVMSIRLAMGVGKPSAIIYSSSITDDITTITKSGS